MHKKNKLSRRALMKSGSFALVSGAVLACNGQSEAFEKPLSLPRGSFYTEVDDIRVYCEVSGQGPLLIHQTGVWLTSIVENDMVKKLNKALTKHFTVLTFDGRGQGKTTLGNGPITYGRFAADTVRLMDVLGIEKVHFFGHSDGGCIQLDLLLHFSDRVKTSTLSGTPHNLEAYNENTQAVFDVWFKQMVNDSKIMGSNDDADSSLEFSKKGRDAYAAHSPHPEKFEEILSHQRRCWSTEPDISLKQLARIERPVLVINSGKDEYIPSKSMQSMAAAILKSEQYNIPDMTHLISPFEEEIAAATANFTKKQISL